MMKTILLRLTGKQIKLSQTTFIAWYLNRVTDLNKLTKLQKKRPPQLCLQPHNGTWSESGTRQNVLVRRAWDMLFWWGGQCNKLVKPILCLLFTLFVLNTVGNLHVCLIVITNSNYIIYVVMYLVLTVYVGLWWYFLITVYHYIVWSCELSPPLEGSGDPHMRDLLSCVGCRVNVNGFMCRGSACMKCFWTEWCTFLGGVIAKIQANVVLRDRSSHMLHHHNDLYLSTCEW